MRYFLSPTGKILAELVERRKKEGLPFFDGFPSFKLASAEVLTTTLGRTTFVGGEPGKPDIRSGTTLLISSMDDATLRKFAESTDMNGTPPLARMAGTHDFGGCKALLERVPDASRVSSDGKNVWHFISGAVPRHKEIIFSDAWMKQENERLRKSCEMFVESTCPQLSSWLELLGDVDQSDDNLARTPCDFAVRMHDHEFLDFVSNLTTPRFSVLHSSENIFRLFIGAGDRPRSSIDKAYLWIGPLLESSHDLTPLMKAKIVAGTFIERGRTKTSETILRTLGAGDEVSGFMREAVSAIIEHYLFDMEARIENAADMIRMLHEVHGSTPDFSSSEITRIKDVSESLRLATSHASPKGLSSRRKTFQTP